MPINRPLARRPLCGNTLRKKLDTVDSLAAELARLTAESCRWGESTSPRKADALMRRCDRLRAKFKALMDDQDVLAAIQKREAQS